MNEFDLPVWWSLSHQMFEEEWQIANRQRCNIDHIVDLMWFDESVLDWIVVESSIPINTLFVDYFSNIISIIKVEIIDSPLDNKYRPSQLSGHQLHYCLCKHNYYVYAFQQKASVFDNIRHYPYHHFWESSMAGCLLKWYRFSNKWLCI